MTNGRFFVAFRVGRLLTAALPWIACLAVHGQEWAVAVRSEEEGWPQFRGPGRDGISGETGLLREWRDGGPPVLWTIDGLGKGYSSPTISGDRLYITGDVGDDLAVFCFDLDGQPIWRSTNGRRWERPYPGARSTCTYSDGMVYSLNAHGRLACFRATDGQEVWAVNILERFGSSNIKWGISECPLVADGRVYVTPGGDEALMAALDKRTGAVVWRSEPLRFLRTAEFGGRPVDPPRRDADRAGYASPLLFRFAGQHLLVSGSARHFFCIDVADGRLLWTQAVPVRFEVIGAMPVLWRDTVLLSAPDDFGGRLYRMARTADGIGFTELWETPVDNCHGALVAVGDRFYGAGYRRYRHWAALEAADGTMLSTLTDMAKGAIVYADERLYALSEGGEMALLRPSEDGFEVVSRFRFVSQPRQRDAWAHPVIHNRRLYLRKDEALTCFNIAR